MHTDELLNRILLAPSAHADRLIVVSGYVSGSMSLRHAFGNKETGLQGLAATTAVDIVYGMYPAEGVLRADHQAFLTVQNSLPNYCVHYYQGAKPLHAKVYVWLQSGTPFLAFLGSANYSVSSFYGRIQEAVSEVDPALAFQYASSFLGEAARAQDLKPPRFRSRHFSPEMEPEEVEESFDQAVANLDSVSLPLWSVTQKRMHEKAGLNWGQRDGREPNQAYIPVPSEVSQSGFFPARGDYFIVLTDDGETLDCVIAQDGEKAIETPLNNSTIGVYFRNRLKIPLGQFVSLDDLDRYGRRDVTIYRAGEDRYLLDFRPPA